MPEDCLPDGVSMEDIAESWAEFNGIIVYKPSASRQIPQQVANNSTNIGITELLNLQLKFFEDISGVNGALQGKPGFSGQSASMYNQQVQNSTMSLLDMLECFSQFTIDGAYKDVKNMQQFYDTKRVFNIAGKSGAQIEYDPKKIRDWSLTCPSPKVPRPRPTANLPTTGSCSCGRRRPSVWSSCWSSATSRLPTSFCKVSSRRKNR